MSKFKVGDRVRCVKLDVFVRGSVSLGQTLLVEGGMSNNLFYSEGRTWYDFCFELANAPRDLSNTGHLRLSTARWAPVWVSRP